MRVVSLAPSCTEVAFALRCGEQLIGRTAFCDYPEEVDSIPALGGWTTANLDAVISLKPNLVLTSTFLQDTLVAALRERGLTVCHTDPRTLADVLDSLEVIALALGVPERGKELREAAEAELGQLASWIKPLASVKIYAEEWPLPAMASGNWVPDLIALSGGVSLLQPGERSQNVTLDEIRAFDPDLILLNYCGMAAIPAEYQIAKVTQRPGWEELRAVRAGRFIVLDDSLLNRPGPRLVEGAKQLHHALAESFAAVA